MYLDMKGLVKRFKINNSSCSAVRTSEGLLRGKKPVMEVNRHNVKMPNRNYSAFAFKSHLA